MSDPQNSEEVPSNMYDLKGYSLHDLAQMEAYDKACFPSMAHTDVDCTDDELPRHFTDPSGLDD